MCKSTDSEKRSTEKVRAKELWKTFNFSRNVKVQQKRYQLRAPNDLLDI